MFLKKIQVALVRAAFCFLAAVVGFLTCQACAEDEKQAPVVAGRSAEVAESKEDLDGDPLPAGAIGRLGTSRLRQVGLGGPYYDRNRCLFARRQDPVFGRVLVVPFLGRGHGPENRRDRPGEGRASPVKHAGGLRPGAGWQDAGHDDAV